MMPMDQKQAALKRELDNAESIDFEQGVESWTVVKLADGGELKVRMVVMSIKRLDDDPLTGKARYAMAHQGFYRVTKEPDHRNGEYPYRFEIADQGNGMSRITNAVQARAAGVKHVDPDHKEGGI